MSWPAKLLSFGGCVACMLLGLAVDLVQTPLFIMDGLCRTPGAGLLSSLESQLRLMPFLHVGMLLGWLACRISLTLPVGSGGRPGEGRRIFAELLVMVGAMAVASAWTWSGVGEMLLGMVLGMVVAFAIMGCVGVLCSRRSKARPLSTSLHNA